MKIKTSEDAVKYLDEAIENINRAIATDMKFSSREELLNRIENFKQIQKLLMEK